MNLRQLPPLGPNVKFLGQNAGPDEDLCIRDGIELQRLFGRYRVDNLLVEISWVVDHPMGSFREPHELKIEFDAEHFGTEVVAGGSSQHAAPLDGITTTLLRSIPMAHARALMRDRHEQLSVASIKDEITPLPARVESEADYVHVSCAYVALGSCSVEPIKRLAEWTGESVDTWSARLRRARAKGILEGRGRNSRIAPSYFKQSNEIWSTMRKRKDTSDGRH
ncbi:hypothetical protein MOD31_00400 [Paenarthrobacter sp. TYUT067]|uniref:hypothetical protein n=1 Tax=Paenarthrobacter sp. TYUT067 TaxID=2926245 RepID=UPI00202E930D|nr:hypothetical protein [Paenarthrobacter sp. TYUT067]MCM0614477.1 hypothetical protein [Paenarthrobacter sp. TYUT067]